MQWNKGPFKETTKSKKLKRCIKQKIYDKYDIQRSFN